PAVPVPAPAAPEAPRRYEQISPAGSATGTGGDGDSNAPSTMIIDTRTDPRPPRRNDGISTVITRGPAPVPAAPSERDDEPHTFITRTEPPQSSFEVPASPEGDVDPQSFAGHTIPAPGPEPEDPLGSDIINLDDYKHPEVATPLDQRGSFLPGGDPPPPPRRDDLEGARLTPQEPPISEHDRAFSSYLDAGRGVYQAPPAPAEEAPAVPPLTPGLDDDFPSYPTVEEPPRPSAPAVPPREAAPAQERPAPSEAEPAQDDPVAPSGDDFAPQGGGAFQPDLSAGAYVPGSDQVTFPTKAPSKSMVTAPHHQYGPWRPDLGFLADSPPAQNISDDQIEQMISDINRFMVNFNVKAQVADFQIGPVVVVFHLQLDSGVRWNAIANLSQDLARELRLNSSSVRVISMIPGTPFVGLEVPNPCRRVIALKELAESREFQESDATLPFCLGCDQSGQPIIEDLAKAPHLLVAGATGAGKSSGVNAILISLLLKRSPEELRLVLIDPKTVEFTRYEGLPHLITPIITDVVDQSPAALQWLIDEQERRYALISRFKVNQVKTLNQMIREANARGEQLYDPMWDASMGGRPEVLRPLPSIVLVVDEWADLVMASSARKRGSMPIDTYIQRLAAKARAAGIHIVLATQTPRAEVVTGLIKANLPSRIAFTVAQGLDSRVILDESGAESLLGRGDMLVKYNNAPTFRAQAPLVTDEDVGHCVELWRQRGEPEYIEDVTTPEQELDEVPEADNGQKRLDPDFDKVAAYAREYYDRENKYPSVTGIEIQFGYGWTRAKRLFEQLRSEGVFRE
ncbi:MAG: hypothetical protein K6A65_05540, partial [Succinivibrionaceae bacterium]|nr:hypothetical protein [Succinivibrionaceae bacterium]